MSVIINLRRFSLQDFGMTLKQAPNSLIAPDGAKYATLTDGAGNLVVTATSVTGSTQTYPRCSLAPDGSMYMTLTDGAGNLV